MISEVRREPITDASAWRARDMKGDPSWKVRLEESELRELDEALRGVTAARLPIEEITRERFPLPALSKRLAQWLEVLNDGRGFVLLRGFPVERYSEEDLRTLYWGLSLYLGRPLSQNSFGELIGDIWNEGVKLKPGEVVGSRRAAYGGTQQLRFHTDRADIVGLLCLSPAMEGGLSCILSATTIYNEILANHPEYLPALYNGFIFMNTEDGGDGSTWRVPMFSQHDGVVSCRLSRNTVERARAAGAPFTETESKALEYLDELTARDDIRLDMDFERGDIQFINNFTTMHARTSFVDYPEPERRRHLLRIWLQPQHRRPINLDDFKDYNGLPKLLNARPEHARQH